MQFSLVASDSVYDSGLAAVGLALLEAFVPVRRTSHQSRTAAELAKRLVMESFVADCRHGEQAEENTFTEATP